MAVIAAVTGEILSFEKDKDDDWDERDKDNDHNKKPVATNTPKPTTDPTAAPTPTPRPTPTPQQTSEPTAKPTEKPVETQKPTDPPKTEQPADTRMSAAAARKAVTNRFGGIVQKIQYNYNERNPLFKGEALTKT